VSDIGLDMERGDLTDASAIERSTTYLPGAEIPNVLLRSIPDLQTLPNSITVKFPTRFQSYCNLTWETYAGPHAG
jgi:hypothetical protein